MSGITRTCDVRHFRKTTSEALLKYVGFSFPGCFLSYPGAAPFEYAQGRLLRLRWVTLRGGVEAVGEINRLPDVGADARFHGLVAERVGDAIVDGLLRDCLGYGE